MALALGVVLAGAAGTAAIARSDDGPAAVSADVTGRPSMAAEEVPDEVLAPEQLGDRSVASFSAFLDTVRGFSHGAPAPRPPDLAGLLERTSTSASGTVAAVSLELGTDRLGELQASRIDLVVDLRLDEVVEADARTDAVRWVRTVWSGDPVLGEQLVERFRAELGEGPVGARAVLFGNVVDTGDGPVLATFDGLVEDASGAARMSLVLSEPDDVLPSVDAAVEELTS
ncbi:MAG: hypothetical protein KDA98_15830 [Acidimicrobiales bacterium]|nr:hypothetical protein [Acidimicrobiales bacterium]